MYSFLCKLPSESLNKDRRLEMDLCLFFPQTRFTLNDDFWPCINSYIYIYIYIIYIYLVTITRPPVPTTSSGSICPVSRWLWQSLAHSTPKFGQLSRWRQPWFHHQLLVVWTTYHQPDIYLMIINHLQFHQISLEQFSVCCSFLQTICSKSSPIDVLHPLRELGLWKNGFRGKMRFLKEMGFHKGFAENWVYLKTAIWVGFYAEINRYGFSLLNFPSKFLIFSPSFQIPSCKLVYKANLT